MIQQLSSILEKQNKTTTKEYLLFLLRTGTQFPASTQQLTTYCNSSSRRSLASTWCIYTHADSQAYIHINLKINQKSRTMEVLGDCTNWLISVAHMCNKSLAWNLQNKHFYFQVSPNLFSIIIETLKWCKHCSRHEEWMTITPCYHKASILMGKKIKNVRRY